MDWGIFDEDYIHGGDTRHHVHLRQQGHPGHIELTHHNPWQSRHVHSTSDCRSDLAPKRRLDQEHAPTMSKKNVRLLAREDWTIVQGAPRQTGESGLVGTAGIRADPMSGSDFFEPGAEELGSKQMRKIALHGDS